MPAKKPDPEPPSSEIILTELYFNRRAFLKAAGLLGFGGLLAACGVPPVAATSTPVIATPKAPTSTAAVSSRTPTVGKPASTISPSESGLKSVLIDFSTLPDGAIPNPLSGSKWSISGGKALCNPTLTGPELLLDPDLEGTYNSGLNSKLQKSGSPTVTQSAHVHAGSKAQGFTATAQYNYISATTNPHSEGKVFRLTGWARRTAGTSGQCVIQALSGTGGGVFSDAPITDTAYKQHILSFPVWGTSGWSTRWMIDCADSGWDTVELDDRSVKQIVTLDCIAWMKAPAANKGEVEASWTSSPGNFAGVFMNLDNPSNPQNWVALLHNGCVLSSVTSSQFALIKCVAGVISLVSVVAVDYVAGAMIKLRKTTPTTYQMFYDDSKIGADQIISDGSIIGNMVCGPFSTYESNLLSNFSFQQNVILNQQQVVYLGGSITYGTGVHDFGSKESLAWRSLVSVWLSKHYPDPCLGFYNSGIGATTSWYGCVRLQTDVLSYAPQVVFVDFAVNDSIAAPPGGKTNGIAPAGEALIRRLRTALPNAKIVAWVFTWPDAYSYMNSALRTARDNWIKIANTYGVTLLRFDLELQRLIGTDKPADSQVEAYFYGVGNVHPNDAGYAAAAAYAETQLTSLASNNPGGSLPAYIFPQTPDFEGTPIIRTGVDNDGETGTWATIGTARQSNEVNATLHYTGTCASFSFEITAGGTCAWKVDGGSYTNYTTSTANCLYAANRGVHTVTIKIVSGTVSIKRFMAI